MASNYDPNKWELYDPNIPNEDQPHSFITKRKLEKMEEGIREANVELEVGEVNIGTEGNYGVTITEEEVNGETKARRLNITFPPSGKGEPGDDGKSAYEVWLDAGNIGTEQDFLDYLKGIDGKDGKDGKDGADGAPGPKGDSAYQTWLNEGNTGTEEDFLNYLQGKDGDDAYETWIKIPGNENKTITEFYESLKGEKGETGPQGPAGPAGEGGQVEWLDFGSLI